MSDGGGRIARISGPTVIARGLDSPAMYNLVRVGISRLMGEIIRVDGDEVTVQVYEETEGLGLREPVEDSGHPLTVELGPGLLGTLYDGVQRPLERIREKSGSFIERGTEAPALTRECAWDFVPAVSEGDLVEGGSIVGTVRENPIIEHRILVPPGVKGTVTELKKGICRSSEPVAILDDGTAITFLQRWPVRLPRPVRRKLDPDTLFVTGQRVFDTFFPLAEGGTAILPGGFGTGKTVVQHSLAKFAAADIIVFVGCGERGNEMAAVVEELPKLTDPAHGLPLSYRTILIANTSNMPVAAREASIYTGATIAEYYRDQGYRVALMADSTSRWAEALREISSRLEEMPGEEGYPTYLSTRLAGFTERAGRVACLGNGEREGSVTMICAVSPPGGDFSEPVTQSSMRVAGSLWALDSNLAHRRHFPAINPRISYSLYHDRLRGFLSGRVAAGWTENTRTAISLLQKEEELREVVQLVGIDSIPDRERVILETGKMIREGFLSQNAFHEDDSFCELPKQFEMLRTILDLHRKMQAALEAGLSLEDLLALPLRDQVARMRELPNDDIAAALQKMRDELHGIVDEACRRVEDGGEGAVEGGEERP
jgi:V/A-type H+-transporting ATPase subunit A